MRSILITFSLLFFTFQSFGQTYTGDQKDIDQILQNAASFSSYVVAADYDKIADSYTKDGKIFPNKRKIIEGREKIRAYWVLPEGVSTVSHKVTASEIKVIGDEAYDYGYYEGATKSKNGSISRWGGKYVIVWKKVNGDWKMYLDIWNSI